MYTNMEFNIIVMWYLLPVQITTDDGCVPD